MKIRNLVTSKTGVSVAAGVTVVALAIGGWALVSAQQEREALQSAEAAASTAREACSAAEQEANSLLGSLGDELVSAETVALADKANLVDAVQASIDSTGGWTCTGKDARTVAEWESAAALAASAQDSWESWTAAAQGALTELATARELEEDALAAATADLDAAVIELNEVLADAEAFIDEHSTAGTEASNLQSQIATAHFSLDAALQEEQASALVAEAVTGLQATTDKLRARLGDAELRAEEDAKEDAASIRSSTGGTATSPPLAIAGKSTGDSGKAAAVAPESKTSVPAATSKPKETTEPKPAPEPAPEPIITWSKCDGQAIYELADGSRTGSNKSCAIASDVDAAVADRPGTGECAYYGQFTSDSKNSHVGYAQQFAYAKFTFSQVDSRLVQMSIYTCLKP